MATQKLEVTVAAKGGAGGQARGGAAGAAAGARDTALAKQADAMRRAGGGAEKQLAKSITQLTRFLQQNTRAVQRQTQETKKNETVMRMMIRNFRAGRGGNFGAAGTGGVGGAIARIGAALPFGIGVAAGAAGFVVGAIKKIGESYLSIMSRQIRTAGIAGVSMPSAGIFTGEQIGAGRKAQIMAAGGPVSAARRGVLSFGPAAGVTQYNYAAMFGLAPADVMSQAGMMTAAGARGPQAMRNIISGGMRGGIGTEMPIMLRMLNETMTEAVSTGITRVDLPESLAKEIKTFAAASASGQVRAIAGAIKNLQQVQKGVASGGMFSSVASHEMYLAAINIMKNKDLSKMFASDVTGLSILGGKTRLGELDFQQRTTLAQHMQQSMPEAVRKQFLQGLVSGTRNFSEFATRAQGYYGMKLTPSELIPLYKGGGGVLDKRAEEIMRKRESAKAAGGILDLAQLQTGGGLGPPGWAGERQVRREYLATGYTVGGVSPGRKSAEAVMMIEKTLTDAAITMAEIAEDSIKVTVEKSKEAAKGLDEMSDKIKNLKNSVTDFIDSSLSKITNNPILKRIIPGL